MTDKARDFPTPEETAAWWLVEIERAAYLCKHAAAMNPSTPQQVLAHLIRERDASRIAEPAEAR